MKVTVLDSLVESLDGAEGNIRKSAQIAMNDAIGRTGLAL